MEVFFSQFTNNRVESINSLLKKLIQPKRPLCELIQGLFDFLRIFAGTQDAKYFDKMFKVANVVYPEKSISKKIMNLFTPYISKFLIEEFESHDFIDVIPSSNGDYTVKQNYGNDFTLTVESCTCIFYKAWKMPCQHLFYVRKLLDTKLFEENMCDSRWFKATWLQQRQKFSSQE